MYVDHVCVCVQSGGLHYKDSEFHRVVPGQCVQGGKLGSGGGSVSVYGGSFEDERLDGVHERGCVSMANSGKDRNGSQFFVCLKRVKEWDGKHVVFGRVVSGLRVSVCCTVCMCLCAVA